MSTPTSPNVLTSKTPVFEGFLLVRTAKMLLQINNLSTPYVLGSSACDNVCVALQYNAETSSEIGR